MVIKTNELSTQREIPDFTRLICEPDEIMLQILPTVSGERKMSMWVNKMDHLLLASRSHKSWYSLTSATRDQEVVRGADASDCLRMSFSSFTAN